MFFQRVHVAFINFTSVEIVNSVSADWDFSYEEGVQFEKINEEKGTNYIFKTVQFQSPEYLFVQKNK